MQQQLQSQQLASALGPAAEPRHQQPSGGRAGATEHPPPQQAQATPVHVSVAPAKTPTNRKMQPPVVVTAAFRARSASNMEGEPATGAATGSNNQQQQQQEPEDVLVAARHVLAAGIDELDDADDDGRASVGPTFVDELEVTSYIQGKAIEAEKRLLSTFGHDKNEWSVRENKVINTAHATKLKQEHARHSQQIKQIKLAEEEKWRQELAAELDFQRRAGLRT